LAFVAGGIVLGGAAVITLRDHRGPPIPAPITSIAILPFKQLNLNDQEKYWGIGTADIIITRLSNLKELTVRPTSAVIKYATDSQDAIAAGRDQKVDAVLDASFWRSGEKWRVTARLVNVHDGSSLWTYQCEELCTDEFEVQNLVAVQVAQAVIPQLTSEARSLLTRRYTENRAAYRLYSEGRAQMNNWTESGLRSGIDSFQRAINMDHGYSLAYAGMARCYSRLSYFGLLDPKEGYPKAEALATQALRNDDQLSEGHTALAEALFNYEWDWQRAEQEYRSAIDLDHNNLLAHLSYSSYLSSQGRHDAGISVGKIALDIEPTSVNATANLGWLFYLQGQYDLAIEQNHKALKLDPHFAIAHRNLGWAYEQKRMYNEAITAFKTAASYSEDAPVIAASIGHVYGVSGRSVEARRVLNELKGGAMRCCPSAFDVAIVHIGLGENDLALDWLNKAFKERSLWMIFAKVDPRLDSLRSDPRFANLMRQMRLAQ